jgi:hypothetical protein
MSVVPVLADAAVRLRGKPGRPRKARASEMPLVQQIRRLVDLEAAADYLGVSTWTIRDLEAAGVLPRVHVPTRDGRQLRRLLFDVKDIDRLVESWKDPR